MKLSLNLPTIAIKRDNFTNLKTYYQIRDFALVVKNFFLDVSKAVNAIYTGLFSFDALWEDNITSLLTGRPGASSPTLTAFGPSGTNQAYVFGVNDFIYTAGFHITHDIKVGSDVYPHVHWATDGTDANTVKWEMSFTYAAGHNQAAFPADTVVTVEQAGSGIVWQHMITEVSDGDAFTAPEVDSIIMMRLRRVTNGGTDNSDDVFGVFVDLHYQKARLGTINKAPNFYG